METEQRVSKRGQLGGLGLDKWTGCTDQTRTVAQVEEEEMKHYMDVDGNDDGLGCVFATRVHDDDDGKAFLTSSSHWYLVDRAKRKTM